MPTTDSCGMAWATWRTFNTARLCGVSSVDDTPGRDSLLQSNLRLQ
ncbi:hypothetical protein LNO81_19485 [Klebsiella variicola subsp. variicola]|nr:hypothetical protein [Klebsiella variicola subsp. variicola]